MSARITTEAPARPRGAEWLATMRCNLQCHHCCADAGSPAQDELDEGEAKDVLSQLAELGVEHLCISGGEFTLRPDWEALLRFALSRFPSTSIITNGRLGGPFVAALDSLNSCSALTVIVSIDGSRDVHDARRGSGSFARALELLHAPRGNIQLAIQTTVGRDNDGELEAIGRLAVEVGAFEWSLQPAIPIGRMAPVGFIGGEGLLALADFIHAARGRFHPVRVGTNCWFGYFHPMRQEPWAGCPAARDHLAIMPQGDVSACLGVSQWVCGNVRHQSLRAIWEGPAMQALRGVRPTGCGSCSRCPGGCQMIEGALGTQYCSLEPAGASRSTQPTVLLDPQKSGVDQEKLPRVPEQLPGAQEE